MGFLKSIWKFINSQFFGYLIIFFLIALVYKQCSDKEDLKREIDIRNQNIAAADSLIKAYKDKEGRLTSEKAIWILTEKDLRKQNSELFKLVDQQKGKIISLNSVILKLMQDTTILNDTIKYLKKVIGKAEELAPGEWKLPWALTYNWDSLNYDIFKGFSIAKLDTSSLSIRHLDTEITYRESQIHLVFGEKVVNGLYNVYVTSSYPGLSAKSMEGVFIDPNDNKYIRRLIKKEHWFTGFSIGVGISPSYDFINRRPAFVIGPTLGFKIYDF